ncbi:hypothetical protein NKH69_33180, partial [Mesorhizobium sp. M0976]|uniref:hypothetical protein n=1 Tax=Mesorhizobium sp. M0976 TaxID=2957038 RepID=UPI0033358DD0
RQSNSSLITPDTVPDSKAIRRKRPRQRAGKIALTLDKDGSPVTFSALENRKGSLANVFSLSLARQTKSGL